jgi:hypothetical protein
MPGRFFVWQIFRAVGTMVDEIVVEGLNSGSGPNYFTLMEVRAATLVPEPSTLFSIGFACMALVFPRRRKTGKRV